eukprot:COSAG01_NODE_473_length_16542_cov_42.403651_21_plen_90_part_00
MEERQRERGVRADGCWQRHCSWSEQVVRTRQGVEQRHRPEGGEDPSRGRCSDHGLGAVYAAAHPEETHEEQAKEAHLGIVFFIAAAAAA